MAAWMAFAPLGMTNACGGGVFAFPASNDAAPGDEEPRGGGGESGANIPLDGASDSASDDTGGGGSARMAAAFTCAEGGVACLNGGIFSGTDPFPSGDAGSAPSGAVLTDEGFELGGTSCDSTGMTCVTGGITP